MQDNWYNAHMNIKDQFPIFKNNPNLVYLDSAATSQKPQRVIDSIVEFYSKYNSNVHRGLYPLSEKATDMYESARKTIAEFINADLKEIIFTGGTTDGVNSIVESLRISGLIDEESKILLSEVEHHSNLLPWQRISKNINYLQSYENISEELKNPDILAIALVSNVTGEITPTKELTKLLSPKYIIIDAAQAVGHMKIDVEELGADFIVFSGHKMYGPTGVGVIWGKKELLEKIEPFKVGGGMITEVNRSSASWRDLPEKFEAGTPPISEAIALAEAANFLSELGFEEIKKHEKELRTYLIENLQQIPGIQIYHPDLSQSALGVASFTVEGIHPHDLAQYLGDKNICVRAGHHCVQIYHREVLQIPASLRVSLGIYNTKKDIDAFIKALLEGINHFTK